MSYTTDADQRPTTASPMRQSRQAHPAGPPLPEPVFETRGLQMRYGVTDVLRGVDIRAERGEVVALLGPNGARKTTTIEILEGFRRRSAGRVRVLGSDPDDGSEA